MWRLISILAVLVLTQATDIETIYGEWIQAAYYPAPHTGYTPVCIRYTFVEKPENTHCTYSDGSNATSVQISITDVDGILLYRYAMPMKIVDTPEDVMPALRDPCKLGEEIIRDRAVVRTVSDNYFIMYQNISPAEIEPNHAYLYMKNVVPEKELGKFMTSVEDLKGRRGALMCTKENYRETKVQEKATNGIFF
ncbi:hypothetical protein B5X24_HaOG204558 [Helicoverpa armigera]|nr:hypothetical protein B5X24_HaOG204558 [Helicoverpa armigera]